VATGSGNGKEYYVQFSSASQNFGSGFWIGFGYGF
jgi:hypothetical protein